MLVFLFIIIFLKTQKSKNCSMCSLSRDSGENFENKCSSTGLLVSYSITGIDGPGRYEFVYVTNSCCRYLGKVKVDMNTLQKDKILLTGMLLTLENTWQIKTQKYTKYAVLVKTSSIAKF